MSTVPQLAAVRPFAELSREDVPYAGGKGANLGELTRAGLPVPPGFVIGAPAYAAFCEHSGLRERLGQILDGVDVEDTAALERAAAAAREAVMQAPLPGPLAGAILDAYRALLVASGERFSTPGDGRPGESAAGMAGTTGTAGQTGPARQTGAAVAVRSSATAEDTASASFAGMNETFLNVRGERELLGAVRRCWASLFGARTIYYSGRRGFSQAGMDIAVIVQRQIASVSAGVMFTVDPSSGAPGRLVIEGSFGLGEAVVSGSVSPDRYVVAKDGLAVLTRSVRPKELAIEPTPDGGTVTRIVSEGAVETEEESAPAVSAIGSAVTGAPAPVPVTATRLLVNLSEPSQVQRAAALDVDGVGLLRAELMVLEALDGVHPRQLVEQGRGEEFTARMADALSTFAAGFAPRPVTYRTIDFRTNEFRGLQGGERFEPQEANPMIGYRGALRYTREPDLFALELAAIARVWDAGHRNLHVMLPFVRTVAELARCRSLMARSGLLERPGFQLWIMAEVPSVLLNIERYARLGIAGISIGSNDLTQLLLGADRDSELLAGTFDERDPAVTDYLALLIPRARELGLATSICGQAPSVHPEYAELLVRAGIDSVSVSVDAVDRTRRLLAAAEQRVLLDASRPQRAGGPPPRHRRHRSAPSRG